MQNCLLLKFNNKEFLLNIKHEKNIKDFVKLFKIKTKKVRTNNKPISFKKLAKEFCT